MIWDDSSVVLKVRKLILQGFSEVSVSEILNLKISNFYIKVSHVQFMKWNDSNNSVACMLFLCDKICLRFVFP